MGVLPRSNLGRLSLGTIMVAPEQGESCGEAEPGGARWLASKTTALGANGEGEKLIKYFGVSDKKNWRVNYSELKAGQDRPAFDGDEFIDKTVGRLRDRCYLGKENAGYLVDTEEGKIQEGG